MAKKATTPRKTPTRKAASKSTKTIAPADSELDIEGVDPLEETSDKSGDMSAESQAEDRAKRRAKNATPGTGKNLVIVESPAKAKTINKYLGDQFVVKASMGHIRDLPKSGNAVNMETFEPRYVLIEERGKKELIKELRKLSKDAPTVYLATDLDREGEAIAWHLKEALDLPDSRVKRVIFNAITKDEVARAFEKPRDLDMGRVNAQQARRVLDRIVGYEISPVLWRKVARGLSAGRVQSVAVRLVVDREREIEAFIPDEYWSITGVFSPKNDPSLAAAFETFMKSSPQDSLTGGGDDGGGFGGGFGAVYSGPNKKQQQKWLSQRDAFEAELVEVAGRKLDSMTQDEARRISAAIGFVITSDETTADENAKGPAKNRVAIQGRIQSSPAFRVESIEKKRSTSRPTPPFITSTLQQAGSTRLGFGAQRTMRAAQSLYEAGHITYMRTDSTHLSGDALNMVRSFVQSEFGPAYLPEKPNFYASSNKNAQEAHEAIRPTNLKNSPRDIRAMVKDDESRVYELIYNRFVACQMTNALFDQTAITIVADVPDKTGKTSKVAFRATGRKLVFDGFMKVSGVSSDDQLLPELAEKQSVFPLHLDPSQHFTSPPPRYNEASLIKDLESKGIGRPSTYASIITTIQDRQYVLQQDRRLYATLLGKVVTDKLVQAFPQIMDVTFTADMEGKLDQVEDLSVDWVKLLRDFYGPFHASIATALETLEHAGGAPSPYKDEATGIPLVYRISATGFFLASSDPNVKLTKPVDAFGTPTIKQVSQYKCPFCSGDMIERKGRFGDYLSCSNYSVKDAEGKPSCSTIVPLNKKTRLPDPPKVEALMTNILDAKDGKPYLLRNSKRGPFLGSSNFPKNRTTIQVKKLTPEQATEVESLLPELRRRVQKSYEQGAAMTGRPIESYGSLPPESIAEILATPAAPRFSKAKKTA